MQLEVLKASESTHTRCLSQLRGRQRTFPGAGLGEPAGALSSRKTSLASSLRMGFHLLHSSSGEGSQLSLELVWGATEVPVPCPWGRCYWHFPQGWGSAQLFLASEGSGHQVSWEGVLHLWRECCSVPSNGGASVCLPQRLQKVF